MFGDDCAYRHDQPSEEDEPRDLPEELLLFILSLLPYKSLNNSALVSSKWHRVATDPSLWQDKIISITDSTFHLLGQVLSMPRLARVNYLDLRLDYIMPVAKDMLAIQESQLEMLEMDWSDFSLVEPVVLANTMLNVRQSDVVHFDAKALLSLLADSVNSKLEQLHLNQTDLAEVEVEVFTRAVTKLTTLQMTDLRQEKSHLSALFLVLAEQNAPLRRLMVAGSPLRELEISEEQTSSLIGASVLKRILTKTSFSMASQDVRYYLNGLLLEFDNNEIKGVATDGHRLALAKSEFENKEGLQVKQILPRKAVLELSKLLPQSEEVVELKVGASYFSVKSGNLQFSTKLIDGKYPDYEKVFPSGDPSSLKIEKEKLQLLLYYAPKREDQAIPLISYYVKNNNDKINDTHYKNKLLDE